MTHIDFTGISSGRAVAVVMLRNLCLPSSCNIRIHTFPSPFLSRTLFPYRLQLRMGEIRSTFAAKNADNLPHRRIGAEWPTFDRLFPSWLRSNLPALRTRRFEGSRIHCALARGCMLGSLSMPNRMQKGHAALAFERISRSFRFARGRRRLVMCQLALADQLRFSAAANRAQRLWN